MGLKEKGMGKKMMRRKINVNYKRMMEKEGVEE